MELIIAIVLGGFLIIKLASKMKKDREHDEQLKIKTEQREKNKEAWLNKVTDKKLEDELEEKIYSGLIGEEVQNAFLEAARGLPEKYIASLRYDKEMVLRILMAAHGKLRFEDACLGISVFAHGPTEIRRREDAEMKRSVVYHIQNKLREHGINERVTFQSSIKGGNESLIGDYIWEPLRWE